MLFPTWIQAISRIGDLAATVAAMGGVQHCDVQVGFPLNLKEYLRIPQHLIIVASSYPFLVARPI